MPLFAKIMDLITELQEWYHSQCDGDWEHTYGIMIGNIDNPGWEVKIDLRETELENVDFPEVSYGVGDQAKSSGDDWMICRRVECQFDGCGGPHKLNEILEVFLKWARENSQCEQAASSNH
jgi:hypothetical protein